MITRECTREYHTSHMFFPLNKISQYHFEAKFLRKTNQTKQRNKTKWLSLICSDGHLNSGFLPLSMSMEILKNQLLGTFCKEPKKISMEHQKPANDPIQNRSFQESLRLLTFRSSSGYIKDLWKGSNSEKLSMLVDNWQLLPLLLKVLFQKSLFQSKQTST